MNIINILIHIALAALFFWGLTELLKVVNLPAPIGRIAYIFLVVLLGIWILNAFIGFAPGYSIRFDN